MNSINTNETNPYIKAFNETNQKAYDQVQSSYTSKDAIALNDDNRIHNAAVNVSISTHNINIYLNVKSAESSKGNSSAQQILTNLLNGNNDYINFFNGKTMENGFSLESIGYTGKPLAQLNTDEAKALVDDGGFFGINETSSRISSFVLNMTGDNLEALKESRKGLVQGFEEAKKLFGGELPEISYETQKKTLEVIDKKIAELTKTDFEKKAESNT